MAAAKTLALLSFDVAYLRALHKRDQETETHFFTYFTPLIRRKLRKYLRTPDLIEEGVQETLARVMAAVLARRGIRHPERFGAFVHAVARNVAMETIRREKRFVTLDDSSDGGASPSASPQLIAEVAQTGERVRRVLATLPDLDRQILEAVFLAEEDRSAVCRRFAISAGYLRVLLFRAKQCFIAHMNGETEKALAVAASSK